MSNIFSIKEIENRDILVPMNTPGVERLLKVGARVKVRSDLVEGKKYDGMTYYGSAVNNGKILIIKETKLHIRNIVLENGCHYSLEMLEGIYLN